MTEEQAEYKAAWKITNKEYFLDRNADKYIYKLYSNDELVYIGQSINLENRIAVHEQNKEFDTVQYKKVANKNADIIESIMILENVPRLNKMIPINPPKLGLIKGSELPENVPEEMRKKYLAIYQRHASYYFPDILDAYYTEIAGKDIAQRLRMIRETRNERL